MSSTHQITSSTVENMNHDILKDNFNSSTGSAIITNATSNNLGQTGGKQLKSKRNSKNSQNR